VISHRFSPEPPVAPTAAECVGPVLLPTIVTGALRALTDAAGADDFLPLWICAGVVADRAARRGAPSRACVIQGKREAFTTAGVLDDATSFRSALWQTARSPKAVPTDPGGPVSEVIILVSQDGRRLYAECGAGVEPPVAQWWARSFAELLASLAGDPGAALAEHALRDEAGPR
jgi:hypothetical protein